MVSFEESLSERLYGSEQFLQGFKDSLDHQLEQVRKTAQNSLGEQIKALQDTMDESVQTHSHQIEERLRVMEGVVNRSENELKAIVESTNGEIASWQARVNQALKEHEVEFTAKYTELKPFSKAKLEAAFKLFVKRIAM